MPANTICSVLLLFFVFLVAVPVQAQKRWYKGNLHTHSYWSDGDEFPERIMDWYKSRGYHFLALSDHNVLAEGEKWVRIEDKPLYRQAFGQYLQQYGSDWVVYKKDSTGLQVKLKTLAEYRPLFEKPGHFLVLPAEEITDKFENKHVHLNVTNVQQLIRPQGGGSIVEVLQNNINAVLKQKRETGAPMLVHVNHPNFYYSVTLQDMIQLQGERFFEVFNGHPLVHNFGDSLHIGTEEMWDLINIAYLSQGKPLIYGLATDDSHNYHESGRKFSNAGRGWIMVQADALHASSLIEAMERGQFYATTGIILRDLDFKKNKLTVKVKKERGVNYRISFIGCRAGDSQTRVLQESAGAKASFKLSGDILFVRAKITSDKPHKNPIETADFEMGWTQPVLNRLVPVGGFE